MNLKVRLKNPTFWVTIVPTVLTFVYSILSIFDVVPKISEETVTNIILAVVSALSTLGVLVDPTTKGMGDSERALGYTEPQ